MHCVLYIALKKHPLAWEFLLHVMVTKDIFQTHEHLNPYDLVLKCRADRTTFTLKTQKIFAAVHS